jgi:pantoate--beta-alanine ligase
VGFTKVDYVSIVNKDTLIPIDTIEGEARVISVARFGNVRLLDNMVINPVT